MNLPNATTSRAAPWMRRIYSAVLGVVGIALLVQGAQLAALAARSTT